MGTENVAERIEARVREKLARFYINRLLPEHAALLEQARIGQDDLYAMDLDELAS